MDLYIDVQTSVYQVQHVFSLCYPFLKLDFFLEAHRSGGDEGTFLRRRRVPGEALFPFSGTRSPVHINIDGGRTVRQISWEFWEKFQVVAFISRRSANVWVNTIMTESWSLLRQNEEGELLSQSGGGNF